MAMTLTKDQCADVFKLVQVGVLQKVGYCSKILAIILHRLEKYGRVQDIHEYHIPRQW